MQIKISLKSIKSKREIFLDDEKKIFLVDSQPKDININKFASKLLRIVSSWEERYDNDLNVIDGLIYEINITKDDKNYNFYGENKYPKNFYEFSSLINEVLNV